MRDELEFHGLLVVEPPLTVEEVRWLEQLTDAQHQLSPSADPDQDPPPLPPLAGKPPQGVCGWATCGHGCCLWVDDGGLGNVRSTVAWMRYLIRHDFSAHTFDGVVVVRHRYTTETTAIRVRDNVVERIRLSGPDLRYRGHWDEWADPTPPPERQDAYVPAPTSSPGARIIDLASRRRDYGGAASS